MPVTQSELVAVWTERGVPVRLVWRGIRFRVSDTPTPLRGATLHPALTHPLESLVGWRFQGTADSGESFVFDVHGSADAGWQLVARYE